jgi:hypothetical protein
MVVGWVWDVANLRGGPSIFLAAPRCLQPAAICHLPSAILVDLRSYITTMSDSEKIARGVGASI